MNASVLLLIVVGTGALIFVGFLVADYFSSDSKRERARRKRRRERRKLRRLAVAQSQGAAGSDMSAEDDATDEHE